VDALIAGDEIDLPKLLQRAAEFDLAPRIADALDFARQSRVLLLRHQASGIVIDVVLGFLEFEKEAIARGSVITIRGVSLPVVAPEDLIIMKAVAGRPRDIVDIEAILEAQPALDLARVRAWVKEFADALDMPGITGNLDRLLNSQRPGRGRGRATGKPHGSGPGRKPARSK
jgi:hypothetical protein